MFITCPECNLPVSDKALSCPHCGFPLKENIPVKRTRRKRPREHRRLPNGFGRITKLKRNLANPYRVMVTVGHDENGKPIGKLLKPQAYFPTYNDAYAALVEYNRKPYELDKEITMAELYEKWMASAADSATVSSRKIYAMAWNYCSSVYSLPVRKVRIHHIRHCAEHGVYEKDGILRSPTPSVSTRIKQLWNLLMDYAVEYELIDTNPARAFHLSKNIAKAKDTVTNPHIRFTDEEMQKLWAAKDTVKYVDVILLQCYSGWRPQELGLLRLEDIDLENWTMTGGLKTEAGTNRTIPIHSCIRPIVKNMYDRSKALGCEYLVISTERYKARRLSYTNYRTKFYKVIETLGLDPKHQPHDPRKQFVSMAKDSNVNEYAIKRIVGHAIPDITERVYTEHNPQWLRDEIEKIKGGA